MARKCLPLLLALCLLLAACGPRQEAPQDNGMGMPVQPETTAAISSAVTGRCCWFFLRRLSRSCST